MTKPYRIVIDDRSTTQDLTTVDFVKLDLGLDPLDTEQDEWIVAQIKWASGAIASICNRAFGEETLRSKTDDDALNGYWSVLFFCRRRWVDVLNANEVRKPYGLNARRAQAKHAALTNKAPARFLCYRIFP